MTKNSIMDIVASGGEVTYKKLYIGNLSDVRRGNLKKRFQFESRYGEYQGPYDVSLLYSDLEVAADRFMLIYNLLQNGELK